jgi:thiol-disulfide isomerase/thioredoxin
MLASLVLALVQAAAPAGGARAYSAWLTTPGGPLRFGLELDLRPGAARAFLVNGAERIAVPRVELSGDQLLLEMPHYDARIRATLHGSGAERLTGIWEKRRGPDSLAWVPFGAQSLPPSIDLAAPPTGSEDVLTGRWRVRFETDPEPAVALLEQRGTQLNGTFLTATGDYRYLSGSVHYSRRRADAADGELPGCADIVEIDLTLSCFDGAHAFLFEARLVDGRLHGDFHSGDWHHETWTAERDDSAALDDPFAQTRWNGTTKLAELVFPDLDGVPRNLADFAGDATLLVVFGSWCPNCHDEARLLAELDRKYRARGLRILMLAFELTGEHERDAAQVRIFQERHELELPFFLCGTADKAAATEALGLVDRVRAFPTTVFVGADGLPRAVHSGFAGPATGAEHAALVREFEQRIEALLAR